MIKVTTSMERYQELLEAETRVNVAVERIINQSFISNEDILRILGTKDALREAERLKEKSERIDREWNKQHGFTED